MGTLLAFFIIAAIAAGWAFLLRLRIEHTAAMAIFTIMVVMYASGLLGLLHYGVFACVGLAVVAVGYAVYMALKKWEIFIRSVFTPGLLVFVIFFALAWWGESGRMMTHNDEFAHWGLVVKDMVHLNDFATSPDAVILFPGYNPGISLFQYFWCRLSGAYDESYLYRALALLMLTLVLPAVSGVKWKNWRVLLPAVPLLALVPLAFHYDAYEVLQVDTALGLMVAYMLYLHFTAEKGSMKHIPLLCGAAAGLALAKSSGAALVALALCIIAADYLAKGKDLESSRSGRVGAASGSVVSPVAEPASRHTPFRGTGSGAPLRRAMAKPLLVTLACAGGAAALAQLSWSWHVRVSGATAAWEGMTGLTPAAVGDLLSGSGQPYQYRCIDNFLTGLITRPVGAWLLNMTALLWVLALSGLAVYLRRCARKTPLETRWKPLYWGLLVGTIVYSFAQMVLYVFTYTEAEANNLTSFSRYLGTWLVAFLATLVMLLLHVFTTKRERGRFTRPRRVALVLVGALLFINPTGLLDLTLNAPASGWASRNARGVMYGTQQVAEKLSETEDKVYAICQDDPGGDFYQVKYTLAPVHTQRHGWSITAATATDLADPWKVPKSVEGWLAELSEGGYTHVYLFHVSGEFIEEYGAAFNEPQHVSDGMLFRVTPVGENVRLDVVF